jgi:hypothetical protein
MTINFYIKEESNVGVESLTITIVKNSPTSSSRSHISNSKRLDDFTAIEQQTIKELIKTIEKYSSEPEGAHDLTYNL